jgi:hypothetical protein
MVGYSNEKEGLYRGTVINIYALLITRLGGGSGNGIECRGLRLFPMTDGRWCGCGARGSQATDDALLTTTRGCRR